MEWTGLLICALLTYLIVGPIFVLILIQIGWNNTTSMVVFWVGIIATIIGVVLWFANQSFGAFEQVSIFVCVGGVIVIAAIVIGLLALGGAISNQ